MNWQQRAGIYQTYSHEQRYVAMAAWGVCYGAGFGAGLGFAFVLAQAPVRSRLRPRLPES